jgi:hypothetical protein
MDFEETQDMYNLYMIDPMLACTCDEFHICQVCCYLDEQEKKKKDGRASLPSNHSDE